MAGMLRRAIALCIDFAVAVAAAMWITLLPSVFIPLDRMGGWQAVLALPVYLAMLGYVFVGAAVFSNTYGPYLFGIRVVDDRTGARPGLKQAFLRTLTVGLWPIEAMLMAFSRSRRRLGDRWADTRVVRYTPSAGVAKRLVPAAAIVLLLASFFLLVPLVAQRTDAARAAGEYARWELGARAASVGFVGVVNDSGSVELKLDDGRAARVHLVRERGRWRAHRVESIPPYEVGRGFSMQRGRVGTRSE